MVLTLPAAARVTAKAPAILIVMSIIGWPGNNPGNNYTEYFLMIGATLVIIILLRYLQVKRLRMRDKWNKDDDPAK